MVAKATSQTILNIGLLLLKVDYERIRCVSIVESFNLITIDWLCITDYVNPCSINNGGCSHLCLLSASGSISNLHSCACPIDMVFDQGSNTECVDGESDFDTCM